MEGFDGGDQWDRLDGPVQIPTALPATIGLASVSEWIATVRNRGVNNRPAAANIDEKRQQRDHRQWKCQGDDQNAPYGSVGAT